MSDRGEALRMPNQMGQRTEAIRFAQRQYVEDAPKDIQDLIFEDRCPELTHLPIDQKSVGKT